MAVVDYIEGERAMIDQDEEGRLIRVVREGVRLGLADAFRAFSEGLVKLACVVGGVWLLFKYWDSILGVLFALVYFPGKWLGLWQ
jgi:hypothetical protein